MFFVVVRTASLCHFVLLLGVFANSSPYRSQQYYFSDKNGGYEYGYQIGNDGDEENFGKTLGGGDGTKNYFTYNKDGFNYKPQSRGFHLQSKWPTTGDFEENSKADVADFGDIKNFDGLQRRDFGRTQDGRNLYRKPHFYYGDVKKSPNYGDGDEMPEPIMEKPLGIFVPKENGGFFVTYTVGDQQFVKVSNRNHDKNDDFYYGDDLTQDPNNGGEETTESTLDGDADSTETPRGDASYRFVIDTDDYKRTEESDPFGNVKGHFSYKNEAGTHDLSYEAGGDTGFVATGGSLANPYNQTMSEGESTTDNTNTINIDGYDPTKKPKIERRLKKKPKMTNVDDSYSFFINTDEYKRHEVSDANGRVQGYFFYKINPNEEASMTTIAKGGALDEFPWDNFGKRTITKGGPKLTPPKPVPYPQSKTAYGVNNYVVRTYRPPQKGTLGYVIATNNN